MKILKVIAKFVLFMLIWCSLAFVLDYCLNVEKFYIYAMVYFTFGALWVSIVDELFKDKED